MPAAVADKPIVTKQPTVTKPSMPEILGLAGHEVQAKTPQEILDSLPEQVRKLHKGVRILIADDFLSTAENLRDKLTQIYRPEDGCTIEVESDPIKARERIIEASKSDNPYDVVVLDLFMTRAENGKEAGINGDQLLRDIASQNVFTRTLIHSGEWADRIQGNLWHQIERIENIYQLENVGEQLWNQMQRVPITYVRKYGPATTLQDIVAGIDALLITKDRKPQNLEKYLSNLKLDTKMHGSDMDLARMVELVSLVNTRLQDYKTEAESKFPGFLEAEKEIAEGITFFRDKVTPDVTLEGLKSERGRIIIHDTAAPLGTILGFVNIESIARRAKAKHKKGVEPYLQDPKFIAFARRYNEEFKGYLQMFQFLQAATRKEIRYTSDLNSIIKSALGDELLPHGEYNIKMNPCEEKLMISHPMGILYNILRQPVSNAIKAVRDTSKKEITLTTRREKVGALPAEVKKYFHGLGLNDSDEIGSLEVADTGCGIRPDDLSHITDDNFSRFRETGYGTGYGLSYLKSQIPRCNGIFHVESEQGKGTKFRMYFKLEGVENASSNS